MTYPVLFPPKSDWRPPARKDWIDFRKEKRIALDLETKNPAIKTLGARDPDGAIIGFAVATPDGRSMYLPIGHAGDNLDETEVIEFMVHQFQYFEGDIVGAKLEYDMDWCLQYGITFPKVHRWRDIQVAEPLIDENQDRYALDLVAQRYGIPGKDESLLKEAALAFGVHPKKEMYKLPARYVGAYAEQDVDLPLELLERQEKLIVEQGLEDIYDLECKLTPILVAMRRHGVRMDLARMDEIELWSLNEEEAALREVRDFTGCEIRPGDMQKAAIVAPCIEALGFRVPLSPKTQKPSITDEFMESLEHPVAEHLRRARKMASVRTKFLNGWRAHLVGDRLHGTFNQLKSEREDGKGKGTVSGRLSSTSPNLQQIPARDPELGPLLRSCFLPDEGMEWASIDYSQQEPRMTVHYATLRKLQKALFTAELYRDDPKADHHNMMATLIYGPGFTKQQRGYAKEIFLGLAYGMGGAKLCDKLGLPTRWSVFWKGGNRRPMEHFQKESEARKVARDSQGICFRSAGKEGQAIIDAFNKSVPFVKKLAKECQAKAEKAYRIKTLLGRLCRFVKNKYGKYDFHKALNRLIQGSCADMTKKALIDCFEAGYFIQLQVHDELCTSVRDRAHADGIATVMEDCVDLLLPVGTDVEMGPSWGHSMVPKEKWAEKGLAA